MTTLKIGLIGGGRMGRALVHGMIRNHAVHENDVSVSEPDSLSRAWWSSNLPQCRVVPDNLTAIEGVDWVLVAVKPDTVSVVAHEIAGQLKKQLVISIAAGIHLADLERLFGTDRVVRVMPNTPALVGAGASAFCCGKGVQGKDKTQVAIALASVGIAAEVPDKLMDAITGLSGSGPAMVCLMIEALADGGVLAGLPRPLAQQFAAQTVLGAAKMVLETGSHPGELKDQVASPAGTTIAALQVLEQSAVRGALITAVKKAADRSRELGG